MQNTRCVTPGAYFWRTSALCLGSKTNSRNWVLFSLYPLLDQMYFVSFPSLQSLGATTLKANAQCKRRQRGPFKHQVFSALDPAEFHECPWVGLFNECCRGITVKGQWQGHNGKFFWVGLRKEAHGWWRNCSVGERYVSSVPWTLSSSEADSGPRLTSATAGLEVTYIISTLSGKKLFMPTARQNREL